MGLYLSFGFGFGFLCAGVITSCTCICICMSEAEAEAEAEVGRENLGGGTQRENDHLSTTSSGFFVKKLRTKPINKLTNQTI